MKNFHFFVVKFSVYLNRRVFVIHNHEAQSSRGTKRRRDGEQIRTEQACHIKRQTHTFILLLTVKTGVYLVKIKVVSITI